MLSNAFLGPDESHIIGNLTVREWKKRYMDRLERLGLSESSYAGYAFDAVWVFGLGLHNLLTEDPSALESLHTDVTTRYVLAKVFLY